MTVNQIITFFAILALIAVLGTGAKDNPILGWVLIAGIVADFVWAWQVSERARDRRPVTPEDVRAWRDEHELTQQQMADLLLVTVGTVKRWEYGDRQPPWFLRLALERLDQLLSEPVAQGA